MVVLAAISRVSDGLVNWLSFSRACDGCGRVIAIVAGMRWTWLLLVAISWVSDGHGTLVAAFACMRWMGLFLLPLSRACEWLMEFDHRNLIMEFDLIVW